MNNMMKLLSSAFIFRVYSGVIFIFFIAASDYVFAERIHGRVTDADTGDALAFVNILVEGTQRGTMTDIDGYFNINLREEESRLQLSYVGYFTKVYEIFPDTYFHHISLVSKPYELTEVVVFSGENPAHRIILNAIEQRKKNNPERLASFSYNSYNKIIGTLDRDYYLDRFQISGDSIDYRMAETLEERHLFIMESVTERQYRFPNLDNEKVIANRVSGLENPLFTMLATELQSFSFYNNYITLMGNDYLSPLNRFAFNHYLYQLEDTLYLQRDSVFVISYEPRQETNFGGLKGVLYINNDGWAIQNVIAYTPENADGGLSFRIQQKYDKPDGKHWFPVQLNTDIESIQPASTASSGFLPIKIQGRSYLTDIFVNPPLNRSDFSLFAIDFDPGANEINQDQWRVYRTDTLSVKEKNTYRFMDSLGLEHNFERLLNSVEPLVFGELPIGKLNLILNDVYRINSYEGHRIGIGLQTNRRFSNRFALGGYYAWGTRDKQSKYGYFGEITIHKNYDLKLGGAFSLDVKERGTPTFRETGFSFVNDLIQNYYSNTRDINRETKLYLSFRIWQGFLQGQISASQGKTRWNDAYYFVSTNNDVGYRQYMYSEAALKLRFSYGETLMNTPLRILQLPSRFPVIYLNAIKGFDNVADGEFDYLKFESRIEVNYPIPLLGDQRWIVEAGWADRADIPWSLLYTASTADRRGWLASPFNFGTMSLNEFMADRYFAVFFQHNFQNLLFRTPLWQPELVLITNLGWGSIRSTGNHIYTGFQGWEKGYFESGFAVNKIFPQRWVRNIILGFSPGVEFLYRYGPYRFDKTTENISVKMSLLFSI
jgi:hypothetical protein